MKKHFVLLGMMLIPVLSGISMPVLAEEVSVPVTYAVSARITLIDGDISSVVELDECGRISEPAHYQMEGYEFVGWMNVETGKMWDFNDTVHSDITLKAIYRKLESASVPQTPSSNQTANVNTSVDMDTGHWVLIGVLALFEMGLVIYLKNYVDGTQPHRKEK
jgi:hypothetical protein